MIEIRDETVEEANRLLYHTIETLLLENRND